jgi:SAM-dependent methyltransferase
VPDKSVQPREFYTHEYSGTSYAYVDRPEQHSHWNIVKGFVEHFGLNGKQCLEVGCGRGVFQGLANGYVGIDCIGSVARFVRKPFCVASAIELPFKDNSFDGVWSVTVLEHIDKPEKSLEEIRRVLRPGGVLLLAPAWHCRPWAAQGYAVRPYADLDLRGKIIKASILIRDLLIFRAAQIFSARLLRTLVYGISRGPLRFTYTKLSPNYDRYWTSDSDAVSSMDPYEAILWFRSRGDECMSYKNWISQAMVRTGAIVLRIRK